MNQTSTNHTRPAANRLILTIAFLLASVLLSGGSLMAERTNIDTKSGAKAEPQMVSVRHLVRQRNPNPVQRRVSPSGPFRAGRVRPPRASPAIERSGEPAYSVRAKTRKGER